MEDDLVPVMQAIREHVRQGLVLSTGIKADDSTKHATNTAIVLLQTTSTPTKRREANLKDTWLSHN
jgi:hypothetical protein